MTNAVQSYEDPMIERIEIYCPMGFTNARGFLTIWLKNGAKFTVELNPRFLRVLVVPAKARLEDSGINAAGAVGWRSKKEIAHLIAAITTYPVSDAAITAYVTQLLKRVKRALKESLESSCQKRRFPASGKAARSRRSAGRRADRDHRRHDAGSGRLSAAGERNRRQFHGNDEKTTMQPQQRGVFHAHVARNMLDRVPGKP